MYVCMYIYIITNIYIYIPQWCPLRGEAGVRLRSFCVRALTLEVRVGMCSRCVRLVWDTTGEVVLIIVP
jgi:hypothetical protein